MTPAPNTPGRLPEIRERVRANLAARLSWFARVLPSMKVFSGPGFQFVDSDLPAASLNTVLGVPSTPNEVLNITKHYVPRTFPAAWWLPTERSSPAAWWVTEAGWEVDDVHIGMVLAGGRPGHSPAAHVPPELTVKLCDSPERVQDLGLVLSSVYPQSRPKEAAAVRDTCQAAADSIISGNEGRLSLVAYAGEAPASAVTLIRTGRDVGLYDLVIRPEYHHLPYWPSVFSQALALAEEDAEMIVLLTAGDGVIKAVEAGFEPVTEYVTWHNKSTL